MQKETLGNFSKISVIYVQHCTKETLGNFSKINIGNLQQCTKETSLKYFVIYNNSLGAAKRMNKGTLKARNFAL
jgi:hypothetical protein